MIFFKFEYCLTNFGLKSLKPSKSSITSICPSQYLDAPMPMVGTETFFVIFLDNLKLKVIDLDQLSS